MPTYFMTPDQVRGYFTADMIRSREAQNRPPLSIEQIRALWDALTPTERTEWEGEALTNLTDRMTAMWLPKRLRGVALDAPTAKPKRPPPEE